MLALGQCSGMTYHFHHASEELLVVLRGAPTVRMRDGDRELKEGDVVGFPRGADGGHQIRNESDADELPVAGLQE
jgi:uncharacterized cupin superfamily protein